MSSHERVTPIAEHVQLVVALTQLNSEHLRGEARMAGAEIALEGALAALREVGETLEQTRQIALLREQFDATRQSLHAIETERARLERALQALNAGALQADDRSAR
jgi:hypothetical protein